MQAFVDLIFIQIVGSWDFNNMGSSNSQPEGAPRHLQAEDQAVPATVGTPSIHADFGPTPVVDQATGKTIYEKSKEAVKASNLVDANAQYERFRSEMFAYMLGEAAYDYAEKIYNQNPDDKNVMAFLTETVWLYEKSKIRKMRSHWIDRMDILQRGIDVSRKCIDENPDFYPCHRNYVVLATKAADQIYHWRWMKAVGNLEAYNGIMKRGMHALEMAEKKGIEDHDVVRALAELNGRAAFKWYSPYKIFAVWNGVPNRGELLDRALNLHLLAHEYDPGSLENAFRVAQVLYDQKKMNESRRWYIKVRDGMVPRDPKEEIYQTYAHTHISMHFTKHKWNT